MNSPQTSAAAETATPPQDTIETDAVVIGAGPVGLFQVFELGLLDIHCHVVDSLPYPGGQCAELYADKPIYDIPALPVCTGQELVDRLLLQMAPFKAPLHLQQQVLELQRQHDGRLAVQTSSGTRFLCKAVFIAGGAGSFQPRKLKLPGLQRFEGTQVFYARSDAAHWQGRHAVIVGDGDTALDHVLALAELPTSEGAGSRVTLLHRRDAWRAAPAKVARMRQLCETGQLQLLLGQIIGFDESSAGSAQPGPGGPSAAASKLSHLTIATPEGATRSEPVDVLWVLQGLSPKLGPIADWGLDIERKLLRVDPQTFQTREPGIFAVGDINTYPGKQKLILSGFHEATLAAFAAAPIVHPGRPVQLLYTTSSTVLHQRLGVQHADPSSASEPGL